MSNFKVKEIHLKRLWNHLASVRTYIIEECVKSKTAIRIYVEGESGYMELSPEMLEKKSFQISQQKLESKFGGKSYTLTDFAWRPNVVEEVDPVVIQHFEEVVEEKAEEPPQLSLFD